VGIDAVAEAQHQPRPSGAPGLGPGDPAAGRRRHGRICRHIQTVHTCQGVNAGQILNGQEILVAGTGDPFHPAPGGQGLVRGENGAQATCSRGSQRRARAPPISTTILRRGSRRVRPIRAVRSAAEST